ncbi:aminodeoxychorismate/anthranilate synthase component II [Chakrabartyella piscis]|uniref:anthranilate synthase component II n=1 Tax=Chakrabartyella piscis TaxID=2918914 RepID=UPI002958DB7F|nr:aminodeoxychorismate/anthranilate synthase component II [Chakrabartyella piscis]
MILLIDNYDSFSYNLYQLIGGIDSNIQVVRNDKITIEEIRELAPKAIFLSPGPGHPRGAGICISCIQELGKEFPIFGVCLGHQAICEAYGGEVSYASKLMHGKTSIAKLDTNSKLFQNMEEDMQVARYHSLSAVEEKMPDDLRIIARTETGDIMAVEHKEYPVYGVQFHPESVLTPQGKTIIENFLGGISSC